MWKSKIRKELNLNKLQPFTDSTRKTKVQFHSHPTPEIWPAAATKKWHQGINPILLEYYNNSN